MNYLRYKEVREFYPILDLLDYSKWEDEVWSSFSDIDKVYYNNMLVLKTLLSYKSRLNYIDYIQYMLTNLYIPF